eukprot:11179418-Lingulodinium_polyedra.AAC.1
MDLHGSPQISTDLRGFPWISMDMLFPTLLAYDRSDQRSLCAIAGLRPPICAAIGGRSKL